VRARSRLVTEVAVVMQVAVVREVAMAEAMAYGVSQLHRARTAMSMAMSTAMGRSWRGAAGSRGR
jgi:hypothetical protein